MKVRHQKKIDVFINNQSETTWMNFGGECGPGPVVLKTYSLLFSGIIPGTAQGIIRGAGD